MSGLLPSTTSSASTGVATVGCLAGPGHSLAFKFIPHPMPSRTGRCSLHSGARPLTRRLCQASQASLWPSSLTEFFFFRLPSPPTCVPNQTTAAHSSPAGNPNPVPLSVETPTLCSPCQVRGKRSRDCCGGAASFPPLPLPLSAFSFTCFPSPRSPAGLQDRAALRLQLPSRGRGQERPGAVPDRALRDREPLLWRRCREGPAAGPDGDRAPEALGDDLPRGRQGAREDHLPRARGGEAL
mmetsp:Transcript_17645/g.42319  ORF Transcript_17645/g.42319 Transcript_17645/m.42319 type:complete len:240 (+) Transcript_17645:510-1229(+)